LEDAKALMRMVYGRVDVMMFGHKHKSDYWKNRCGIAHVIASGSAAEQDYIVREIQVSADGISVNPINIP